MRPTKDETTTWIGITLILMIFVIAAFAYAETKNNCDGTLVRGVFWFECIEESDNN